MSTNVVYFSKEEFDRRRLEDAIKLLEEARDAITAITTVQCKMHNISLTLANRMDEVGTRKYIPFTGGL